MFLLYNWFHQLLWIPLSPIFPLSLSLNSKHSCLVWKQIFKPCLLFPWKYLFVTYIVNYLLFIHINTYDRIRQYYNEAKTEKDWDKNKTEKDKSEFGSGVEVESRRTFSVNSRHVAPVVPLDNVHHSPCLLGIWRHHPHKVLIKALKIIALNKCQARVIQEHQEHWVW